MKYIANARTSSIIIIIIIPLLKKQVNFIVTITEMYPQNPWQLGVHFASLWSIHLIVCSFLGDQALWARSWQGTHQQTRLEINGVIAWLRISPYSLHTNSTCTFIFYGKRMGFCVHANNRDAIVTRVPQWWLAAHATVAITCHRKARQARYIMVILASHSLLLILLHKPRSFKGLLNKEQQRTLSNENNLLRHYKTPLNTKEIALLTSISMLA